METSREPSAHLESHPFHKSHTHTHTHNPNRRKEMKNFSKTGCKRDQFSIVSNRRFDAKTNDFDSSKLKHQQNDFRTTRVLCAVFVCFCIEINFIVLFVVVFHKIDQLDECGKLDHKSLKILKRDFSHRNELDSSTHRMLAALLHRFQHCYEAKLQHLAN